MALLGPIKNEASLTAKGEDPYHSKQKDGPGVAAWRQRMGTEAAKQMYRRAPHQSSPKVYVHYNRYLPQGSPSRPA
jgi:hypothetical protein